jgi:hypothetical protein
MDEQISTWMDWIWSSRCLVLSCTSTQSSNLKWVSGGGINSLSHPKSHWLTASEKVSVGWTDAILFKASVHPVPLPRHLAVEVLWQNYSDAMLRRTVGSSGAEDLAAKLSLLAFTQPSDEPLLTRRFIRCLRLHRGASILFKHDHRIDRRFPPMDRPFIRRCCLHISSSPIHPTQLGMGPSVHPTVSS